MKLFREEPLEIKVITESVDENSEPKYYLEGVFMQANIKNRNGRIYPMDIMKPEVERYKRDYVDQGRALGELMHTSGAEINLERVSHKIIDIWQEGDYFKAKAEILDTPTGKIVQAMLKANVKLGVSSRALGSVTRKNGVNYVNSDFHLVTAGDIVYEPSAQTAFPTALYEDATEYEYDPVTGEYKAIKESNSEPEMTDAEITEALAKKQIEAFKGLLDEAKIGGDKIIRNLIGEIFKQGKVDDSAFFEFIPLRDWDIVGGRKGKLYAETDDKEYLGKNLSNKLNTNPRIDSWVSEGDWEVDNKGILTLKNYLTIGLRLDDEEDFKKVEQILKHDTKLVFADFEARLKKGVKAITQKVQFVDSNRVQDDTSIIGLSYKVDFEDELHCFIELNWGIRKVLGEDANLF